MVSADSKCCTGGGNTLNNLIQILIFLECSYLSQEYTYEPVKHYFILCKVHLKLQPEVQTSLLTPKVGVPKQAITNCLNKQFVAVLMILLSKLVKEWTWSSTET